MTRRFRLLSGLLVLAAVFSACGKPRLVKGPPLRPEHYVIAANDRPAAGSFVRYVEPGPGAGGLDVAVTDYRDPSGKRPALRLIGVVHVADPLYFEAVQDVLDDCEAVLFEAILPEGQSAAEWIAAVRDRGGLPSALQRLLVSWFGFVDQAHALDYASERFVHADMTVEEFIAAGGDDALRTLGVTLPPLEDEPKEEVEGGGADKSRDMESDSEIFPADVLPIVARVRTFGDQVFDEPNPLSSWARREFARVLANQVNAGALGLYPEVEDVIITQRNEVAFHKLEETIRTYGAPGPDARIGVFYGAAHMPDLEERVLDGAGYVRQGARWIRAWALRPPLKD